jgi:hypothetical protein
MDHLLYLMFRCDFDVMESLESWEEFGVSKHTLRRERSDEYAYCAVHSVLVVRQLYLQLETPTGRACGVFRHLG